MTIVELSTFIKIPPRTVFHWAKKASAKVSDKMAQAKAHNKAADLTMAECVEVVKAGGNHVLAEFLETSANVQGGPRTNVQGRPKLPSGAHGTAMTNNPRADVCNLVDASSTFTGKPVWALWEKLYDGFENKKNTNYRRMAHNSGMTNLDMIDQEFAMPELYLFAKGFLKLPALPEKKKAPVQGSFYETEAKA